jgi:aquaporin Z
VAPLVGAAIAGITYRYITGETGEEPIAAEGQEPSEAPAT